MSVTKHMEVTMNCEESANRIIDGINVDDMSIEWSYAELAVASVVVFISSVKSRILGR